MQTNTDCPKNSSDDGRLYNRAVYWTFLIHSNNSFEAKEITSILWVYAETYIYGYWGKKEKKGDLNVINIGYNRRF